MLPATDGDMRIIPVGILGVALVAAMACRPKTPANGADTSAAAAGDSASRMTSGDSGARNDSAAKGSVGAWVVTEYGMGPLRTGWTATQVSEALHTTVKPVYHDTPGCAQIRVKGLPPGTMLMFVADTLMRIDVDSGAVRTVDGAGIGDAEGRVVHLYAGHVTVGPHKYTGPTGHYVTVVPPGDSAHRIIFETDGKTVLNYRAGRRPAVEYVEGCN